MVGWTGIGLALGVERKCLCFGWAMAIIRRFRFRQLTIMKTPLLLPPPTPLSLAVKNHLAPAVSLVALLGFAIAAHGATVPAVFSAVTTVPVTAASYAATGNDVALSLAFAPPSGTNLTVVKNTGLAFIDGQFSNLAQGQAVSLNYHSNTYRFVANYYGGTGNDLVLHWAGQVLTAWGYNDGGQLGNGSTSSSNLPVAVTQTGVLAGKTVVSVAAGIHNLALCSDGTIAAWGTNYNGSLGNGSTSNSNVPVAVTQTGVLAGKTIVAVAAGYVHSLALCSDGTLAAWGDNDNGQLGDGSNTNRYVPVAVTQTGVLAGKAVIAVAAGEGHSLALCADGTLASWGYNRYGSLGDGTITWSKSEPVAVTQTGALAGKTVVAVAAGEAHSLRTPDLVGFRGGFRMIPI